MTTQAKAFWEKPLASLDRGEWEALCDGCGRCCLHKLEDEDTGQLYPTNVACKLLDRRQGQCTDYANRKRHVADCVKLDPARLDELEWLPSTCAYRLRHEDQPLPDAGAPARPSADGRSSAHPPGSAAGQAI